MPPQVSVIIPVFNRPNAVRRAIASVLAQTYQDFEIVVIDDASTDESVSVVTAINDDRIRLVRHERRRGGSAARNSGIRSSCAPYVAFLDSDDEWMPSKLQRQLELFERGHHLGLVYSGFETRLPGGRVTAYIPVDCDDLTRKLLIDNVIGGASVGMVRREVFDRVGLFDETLRSGQDVDFWLRIGEQFAAAFVPDVLVRVWQQNTTDRITTNVGALISGRDVFFVKHGQKMVREGVVHLWLRNVGWLHHRLAGDRRTARSLYIASLRARPNAPFTYVLLLLACIPISWLHGLARAKNRLAALVGAPPETWSPVAALTEASTVPVEDSRRT